MTTPAGFSRLWSRRFAASSRSFRTWSARTNCERRRAWKAHQLTGDRKGVWSLFVTKNWRMTFRIDRDEVEVVDLDYEDYH